MFGTRTTIPTPVTLNGITHPVPLPGPRLPWDWDHIVLTACTVAAGVLMFASICWSVTGVGGLLSRAAPSPAAYLAASVFDTVWIVCSALEWRFRYDPSRAVRPRRVGWGALVVAMIMLGINGRLAGGLPVAVAAAAVSAMAKIMWHVVIKAHAHPLDPATQGWVNAENAGYSGLLATAAIRTQWARTEQQITAQPHGSGFRPGSTADPEPTSGSAVDPDLIRAIRAAADTVPGATPQELADLLSGLRIEADPDRIREVLSDSSSPSPARRPGSGDGTGSVAGSGQRLRAVADPAANVRSAVLAAFAEGITTEESVTKFVARYHPDAKGGTVSRYWRMLRSEATG